MQISTKSLFIIVQSSKTMQFHLTLVKRRLRSLLLYLNLNLSNNKFKCHEESFKRIKNGILYRHLVQCLPHSRYCLNIRLLNHLLQNLCQSLGNRSFCFTYHLLFK